MRTAAAWCLLLPCAAAFAPAPPPDSRRRALTTRSAGAGELLAEVRDLARLRPTRDDIVRLSDACAAGDGALRFLRRRKRYGLLAELLKRDAAAYADVAGWLHGAGGVGRDQLPNLERVPLAAAPPPAVDDLVPDCTLTNKTFAETPLDGRLVGVALDTKGPEIRTGALKEGLGSTVQLEKGAKLTVTTDAAFKTECDASTLYMDYVNLPTVMQQSRP